MEIGYLKTSSMLLNEQLKTANTTIDDLKKSNKKIMKLLQTKVTDYKTKVTDYEKQIQDNAI